MKKIRCIKYVKQSYINGIHYFKHSGRIRVNFGNTEENFWILRECFLLLNIENLHFSYFQSKSFQKMFKNFNFILIGKRIFTDNRIQYDGTGTN